MFSNTSAYSQYMIDSLFLIVNLSLRPIPLLSIIDV